jgi:oxygen-dependent protoporphyrinogen oxidase
MKRIIILGAGISGLSLGWFLKRRFGSRISLQILEKSDRPGGWIQTVRKNGFLFEQGPRSCRSKGSGLETLRLIEQLEMQDEIIPADPAAHHRYLLINKKLCKIPSGPISFLCSPLVLTVLPAVFRDLLTPESNLEDESIFDFISRRFSTRIAEKLIDPIVSGIYAGDIRKLSIKSCFPSLHQSEKTSGSVLKGMMVGRKERKHSSTKGAAKIKGSSLFSLKGGMESITNELANRLEEHIIYSCEAKSIQCSDENAAIVLKNGSALEGDRIFSTIPPFALASLLDEAAVDIKKLLYQIPPVSVAVVNFGFHRKVLKKQGFGYLVPSKEMEKVLGVVWDSSIFPQQNQIPEETRLTVMIGGAHMHNFDDHTEDDFLQIAFNSIEQHLGIKVKPDAVMVKIAKHSIPQYLVGHSERVKKIEAFLSQNIPKLTLHGNSFHGISVNDCIANSKRIEENLRL